MGPKKGSHQSRKLRMGSFERKSLVSHYHPRKRVPGENESYTNVLAKKHRYADFKIKNLGQIKKVIFCENKPLGLDG